MKVANRIGNASLDNEIKCMATQYVKSYSIYKSGMYFLNFLIADIIQIQNIDIHCEHKYNRCWFAMTVNSEKKPNNQANVIKIMFHDFF
jgi:hypothetical protein